MKPSAGRSFQFISEVPKPESKAAAAATKAAKIEQRRLVRSNAANYHWSQQRKTWREKQKQPRSSESGSLAVVSPAQAYSESESSDSNSPTMLRAYQVDAAKDDLVYLHSIYAPPDMSLNLMKFNAQTIIPRLAPEIEKGVANPSCVIWVRMAMESPALYKTWVHCASVYYYAIKGQMSLQTPYLLSTHLNALELLNEQMRNFETATSDQNILAVWGLAVHGWEYFRPPGFRAPNQSSMKIIQSLDRYSLMKFVPLHLDGLDALVKMRGGLDQLDLHGLAAIISYSGLVEATKVLSNPRWPYKALCERIIPLEGMHSSVRSSHPLAEIGRGFLPAICYRYSTTAQELVGTLLEMSAFTILLFDNPRGFSESEGRVADQRNLIHHTLMSLPHSTNSEFQYLQNGSYEAIRLASIIYSVLVVFPISVLTAPFRTLASQLQTQISKLGIDDNKSVEELQLITWILVMGGVSAIGSPERIWYVAKLADISRILNISSWIEMKALLGRFLWLGPTNDIDGILLWEEIQQFYTQVR